MALRLWDWLEGLGVRILGWFGLSAALARQLIRFFAVGGLAAITYVAVMAAVVDGFGGRVLLGAFLAFVLATLVSFVGRGQATRLLSPPLQRDDLHRQRFDWAPLCLSTSPVRRARGVVPEEHANALSSHSMFNFAGHRLITFARPGRAAMIFP